MTIPLHQGRYAARFACNAADVTACQRLRHQCFKGRTGVDADRLDAICRHMMVEDQSGRLVAALRLFEIGSRCDLARSYAAQSYDLSGFACTHPMIEIGRFCTAPDVMDADVLRVAWGALTRLVDETDTAVLFGCTSFQGIDPAPYGRAFARLMAKHQGPDSLRPPAIAPQRIALRDIPNAGPAPLPSLLRTYLAMGGWVGEHAVIDTAMNTMHVFTCLEVAMVPPARAAALRALAQAHALS